MKEAAVRPASNDRAERAYRTEGARLWRAVYAFTADRELTDDAVAEAFTQLLRRGDAVQDPERWVWRAGFRIAAGELKRGRRRAVGEGSGVGVDPLATSEAVADAIRALRSLSPHQRAAVILHDYADHPVKVVARILGSSVGAVRVHLSVGRKRLRKLMEVDDE